MRSGNALHRSQIRRNILADFPIPACGALHEDPIAVMQNNGQTIDLRLDHKLRTFHPVIDAADALEPAARIIRAEGICKREDRRRVAGPLQNGRQAWLRRVALASSAVIQSGMFGFDLLEFVQQPVEFQVADDRRIQDMITIIVGMDLLFEFFVSGFFSHGAIIAWKRKDDI